MSIKDLVEESIAENQVAIFSKTWCPYCKKVKGLFQEQYPGLEVKIYELDERDDGSDIQNYLYQKTGQRTVPSVFIGSKHIGGSDDTQALHKKGELSKLISGTTA